MIRQYRLALAVSAWVTLIPQLVSAQGSIAGVVRDTSGAVLPGVTVEAASPALIEKVRVVVTDTSGQYRIVDLRPGIYGVTFTLPGFSSFKRDGIELTGSFTATVDADMRVGAVEETITVTGESPLVDVQSSTRQRVMDHEVLDVVPSGRTATTLGVLIPGVIAQTTGGVVTQDIGGNSGNFVLGLSTHGGKQLDQVYMQGGNLTTAMASTGYVSRIQVNFAGAEEIAIDTSGGGAELATGGVRINILPREGGNTYRGSLFLSYGNDKMQGNNFSQALKDLGLRTPDAVKRNYDVNPGFGGPIMKDKIWFYLSSRINATANYAAESFANSNANNPTLWTYVPDASHRGFNETSSKGGELRLTWQASPRNKVGFSYVEQANCQCPQAVASTTAPEAGTRGEQTPQRKIVVDYTVPVTTRLLFEAGSVRQYGVSDTHQAAGLNPLMISVVEQSNNLRYRAAAQYRDNFNLSWHARSAISYITGSHAYKTGVNINWGQNTTNPFSPQPLNYRFNNGLPNQLTMLALNFNDTHASQGGAFVQDTWTRDRLTLRYGMRFDMFTASYPEQNLGATPFTPGRNVTFSEVDNVVNYKDITPRLGASYDLFGTRKTALKVTLNKYLASLAAGTDLVNGGNPAISVVTSTTRSWNDANRNFLPDCDLILTAANGECSAMANANFGKPVPGATFDPDLMHGWGRRNYNWEFSTGIQHQLLPSVAVDVGYFRRWYGNFVVTDDRTVAPADFDTFSIVAPSDPRLPNGGGYTVTGLYDLKPDKFGLAASNFVTRARNYGKQFERWNGVDVALNVRPGSGMLLQGGLSTGKTVYDNCEIAAKAPESLVGTPVFFINNGTIRQPLAFCHVESPFLTQVKFIGSYTVPKIDVQFSATYQGMPGPVIYADYVATNAIVRPSLGRDLSGGAANQTFNIVHPGTMYGDRLHQLDVRFAKVLRMGRAKTSLSVDIFNALNSATVLSMNNSYGAWQRPTSILLARFAKVNAQIDF
jgi:Carboxypeptidase regulatory-like domain